MFSVLYVDDEHDLLELGKLFLEQSPEFHIETALSAREALESMASRSYDAIVSDYQMPGMDGIAFLKAVRGQFGDIPFILFTGRGREDVVIEAINNGVDFYLQKGGDVKSQFAELSHKIRQAVARRQAEHSLSESEKRLADIINFLPDATFAINREGIIIAWNRAIEEMTACPAATMLGKGDHEYSIPFYGERRPILVDLIFAPDDKVAPFYSNILRQGVSLTAETDLPHPRGSPITVLAKASPLYNREGEIAGAIEAIRDITERKKGEDELRAAYDQITASEEELRGQLDVLEENEKKIHESEARLRYMIGFYEKARGPEQELLGYAVEGAGAVTDSSLGYLAFLNDDESELSMYAWSKSAMKECSIREKPIVYKIEKTGLWGEAVRQRRAVIINDYAAPNPAKKGYPAGHPEIIRHMNVPVMEDDHIVLVAGVANKPSDYTGADIQELSLLMQSLWLVVKQRRTQKALSESEEKYRDLFENSVIGIFRTTLDGKFSAINSTFARISGYRSPDEMIEAIKDIRTQLYVDPQDRDRFMNALKSDGLVKDFEARYYHRDGHPVWVKINASAVHDPPGIVRYYEGTIEDITIRKKTEKSLIREKTFSDAVVDSIPGLLYLYDSDGKLVRWNKSHEAITGYSAEELAGMHLADWYKGDDEAIATITEGVGRALRDGQATAEANLLTKSGKRIPFFFTAKRLEIEGKTYFTGVGIDVTDRNRAQDELRSAYEQITASEEELRQQLEELADNQASLRASEEKFRDLVETSPDIIWEMDAQGVFSYISPQSIALMGYAPGDIVGKNIFSFAPDTAMLQFEEIFTASVRTKKIPPGFDLPIRCSDGHIITVEIRAVILLDRNDQVKGFRGIARDITGEKRTSDELQAAYEHLKASDEKLRGQYDELARSEQRTRESEERYRNVIDFSPFGMHFYTLNDDGSLVFTGSNPAADRILKADNSRFIGRTIEEAFPSLVETEIPDQYRRVARTGDPWQTEQVTYDKEMIRGAFTVSAFQIRPGVMAATFFDITPRKLAEEALRESEEKYRMILEGIQDVFYRSDAAGNLIMASPSMTGLLGYDSLDELLGKNIARDVWLHPEYREAFIDEMKKQGSINNYEVTLRRRDGTPVTVSTSSHFYYNRQGDIAGVEGIFHDITDISEADEQIQLLAGLIEITPVVIIVHDPEGKILYVNQAAFSMHGYTRDEFLSKNLHQLVVPESESLISQRIAQLFATGTAAFDVEHFRKDGSRIPFHVNAKSARWKDRDVIISAATDLTELKLAEEELKKAEMNYRALVENSQSIIYTMRPDGIFTFISPSWTRLLGHETQEVIDQNYRVFLHPDDISECEKFLSMTAGTKSAQSSLEFRVLRKDGSYRWFRSTITPVFDDQGTLVSFVGNAFDFTERRTMENAIREANHKLNLLNSITRHDVVNQLTVLQGYAQIAALKKGDPVMADYLAKILTSADIIAHQIEFTRTYQELGVKAPVWTSLGDVVARVESRVPVKLSGTCRGAEILADPMLERVFFNLFDNSVRHGGRVTEITVRCEREPDAILVIVEDNGTGIPVSDKEKIFGRGFGKNTGLGLFLVREILSITGITIRETGVYGKGARFEIMVPKSMYRYSP